MENPSFFSGIGSLAVSHDDLMDGEFDLFKSPTMEATAELYLEDYVKPASVGK